MLVAPAQRVGQDVSSQELASLQDLDSFPLELCRLGRVENGQKLPGLPPYDDGLEMAYYLALGTGVLGAVRAVADEGGIRRAGGCELDPFAEASASHGLRGCHLQRQD